MLAACLAGVEVRAATPQLCSGWGHSLALRSDGSVYAWGWDGYGQLGQRRSLFRTAPAQVTGLVGIRSVSSRFAQHVIVVANDGRAYAWGDNQHGQIGDGTRRFHGNNVISVAISNVDSVAVGGFHSLARTQDGGVWAWGNNSYGQLGDGTTATNASPSRVAGLGNVTAVSSGRYHSLALRSDGTVWAWGWNGSGELGNGTTTASTRPVQVSTLTDVVAISAGWSWSVALRRDGTVWAWGDNSLAQLGDTTRANRALPAQVAGLTNVRSLSAGVGHGLAVRADGTVWSWGVNDKGQLGLGMSDGSLHAPAQIPGLAGIASVSAGSQHSIALKPDGTLLGWGYNAWGQLGLELEANGRLNTFIEAPTAIPGASGASDINAGSELTFFIANGTVRGMGANNSQQLATGAANPESTTTPAVVQGLSDIVEISCGRFSSFALHRDGALYAWGYNGWGTLGDGSNVSTSAPRRVVGLPAIATVSASSSSYGDDQFESHVLAVDRSGGVWAWGAGGNGQLGNGFRTFGNGNAYWTANPEAITGLPAMRSVAAGAYHSLALDAQGRTWAWGANANGELGDGTTVERITPVQIPGLSSATQLAAGWGFSLGLAGGRVYAWGFGANGELGDGALTSRSTPTLVPALSGVRAVSAGSDHGLAVLGDASLWTWGRNANGEIGDGSFDRRASPLHIASAGRVLSATAGNANTLAAATGGAGLSWGDNSSGQLGDGTFADRLSPQLIVGPNGQGYLNLTPEAALQLPGDKVAAFPVHTLGSIRGAAANVDVTIGYRPQDVGTTGSVFVFALAPANKVMGAKEAIDATPIRLMARGTNGEKETTVPCVLAQLNSSGQLQAISASNLQAYVSGVLSGQGQAVQVLSGVPTATIGGATFYVGYGANPAAMLNNGTNRSVVSVPGSQKCQPQGPQTGWWWNAAEGGRGFSIEASGGKIFFAAFLYDVSGRATWTIAAGNTSLDGSLFQGRLESYAGGQSLAGAHRPTGPVSYVGDITLAFSDASHGTMVWPGGSVAIERFNIIPNGLNTAPLAGQPESGWWWNPNESGRGFFLEWQGNTLFMAGYMFDDAGNPIWYLSSAASGNVQSYSNTWWQYANGQTMTGSYRPAQQVNGNVGPVTIQFQGAETGIMTLPGNRTIPIRRYRF